VQNHQPSGHDLPSVSFEAAIDLPVGDADSQQLVASAHPVLLFGKIPQSVASLGVNAYRGRHAVPCIIHDHDAAVADKPFHATAGSAVDDLDAQRRMCARRVRALGPKPSASVLTSPN
jgi:hypothetical protein